MIRTIIIGIVLLSMANRVINAWSAEKYSFIDPKLDSFYSGCGATKLCFGNPSPCFKTKNCTTAVSVTIQSGEYIFELVGTNNPAYLAVALSSDKNMGGDSVMECVQRNGTVALFTSWTYPKIDPYVSRVNVTQNIVTIKDWTSMNGRLYCKFSRNAFTRMNNITFDLQKDKYNLLLASGSRISDSRVEFHDLLYITTASKVSLSDKKLLYADPKTLYRLHGTFMLIAWISLSNVGILLAGYFKRNWIGRKLCGTDLWFSWHRVFMISTWIVTITAFIIILVEVGGWVTASSNTHAILGIITIALCFIQPIGGFLRPDLSSPNRPIFNIVHKSLGYSATILGAVAIFLAVPLSRLGLPTWMTYVLAAFVTFHVIVHIILFLMANINDGRLEYGNIFQMNAFNGDSNERIPPDTDDEQKSAIREIILGIYVTVNLGVLIALICAVWI